MDELGGESPDLQPVLVLKSRRGKGCAIVIVESPIGFDWFWLSDLYGEKELVLHPIYPDGMMLPMGGPGVVWLRTIGGKGVRRE